MRRLTAFLGGALACGLAAAAPAQENLPRTMIVLDGSGSMWGRIDGSPKIEIARAAVADLVAGLPAEAEVGLMAYGHRREGDCSDIQTVLAPAPRDAAAFDAAMAEISPLGQTPIAGATEAAAEALSYTDTPARVLLISDGRETCAPDVCAAAEALARTGTDFTAHVVGFDVDDHARADLTCLAQATGGRYVPAEDAASLNAALTEVAASEPAAHAIVDDFDRTELGEGWSVRNPAPANYIVGESALTTLTVDPGYIGKEDTQNMFLWQGAALPEGYWDIEIDFAAEFTSRRSIVQIGLVDEGGDFVKAELYGAGNSNDDVILALVANIAGTESREEATFTSDSCCPRDWDLDADLAALDAQGATLVMSKRGREYSAAIRTEGWTPREEQPNPLVTGPVTVLRAPPQPALYGGTWGRDYGELPQTVVEIDRFAVTPR